MNILLSTDNNYVMPTGILMHSIGIHNTQDITYYILVNEQFDIENKSILTGIAHKYNKSIHFCTITDDVTKGLPFGRNNMPIHVSIATYYRLFITKVLPDTVKKIIYLDGDMIVRGSIEELWNTDLTGYAVGVVHDMDEMIHINNHNLPYPMETGYFNAGMLLINVEYWRKNDSYSIFMDFVKNNYDKIVLHDQDVLNSTFFNCKKWLRITYNFQNGFLYHCNESNYDRKLESEVLSTIPNPIIIHYSTLRKPWSIHCVHPYKKVWRHYYLKSEWKKERYYDDKPCSIKEHILFFLFRHDLLLPKSNYRRVRVLSK